jgi:hypothetical protein
MSLLRGAPGAAFVVLGALGGCATLTGSETQGIALQAVDPAGGAVAGAECALSNDKGRWSVKPPAVAVVTRSPEDLHVQCEAKGVQPGIVKAVSRANAGLFGNIVFGGAVGAIIDHSKGTAYDYPPAIRVVFGTVQVLDRRDHPGDASAMPAAPAASPTAAREDTRVASVARSAQSAEPALPSPGAIFRYSWSERQYSRPAQEFQVRVGAVEGWRVIEHFRVAGLPAASAEVDAREPVFTGRRLAEGQSLLEFAPYIPVEYTNAPPSIAALKYPEGSAGPWSLSIQVQGFEPVTVPAGTYRAQRVDIRGTRSVSAISQSATPRRFEFTVWYAPDLKRYIKARHRSWNPTNAPIGDEQVELLEYRAN